MAASEDHRYLFRSSSFSPICAGRSSLRDARSTCRRRPKIDRRDRREALIRYELGRRPRELSFFSCAVPMAFVLMNLTARLTASPLSGIVRGRSWFAYSS